MENTYTAAQVYDSLIRQGYDKNTAGTLAAVIGDSRVSERDLRNEYKTMGINNVTLPQGKDGEQGSNFLPNLAESVGLAVGAPLASFLIPKNPSQTGLLSPLSKFGRGTARFLAPFALGSLGSYAATQATGTNYYDTATPSQLIADISGSYLGDYIGNKIGGNYARKYGNKLANTIERARVYNNIPLKQLGMTGVAKKAMGKIASTGIGRTLGGTIGAIGGPIGSILLGTTLGYLVPKLMPDRPRSVDEDVIRSNNSWSGYLEPFN